jgi:hypothetical protein
MILSQFFVSFAVACKLKQFNFPQENSLYYYLRRTKELYPAEALVFDPKFHSRFVAAPLSAQIVAALPKFLGAKKDTKLVLTYLEDETFIAGYLQHKKPTLYPKYYVSFAGTHKPDTLAKLFVELKRRELLK